jgi:hypothetical protein
MNNYFSEAEKRILCQAAAIAEDLTSDFYKLSHSRWLKARYDILTLQQLRAEEISPHALALVARYDGQPADCPLKSAAFDFYRVCLQDHNILATLQRTQGLTPLPLFCYVLTHELVHIVRFSRFEARFDATAGERAAEEREVHRLTRVILAPLSFLELEPVIEQYDIHDQGGRQYAYL